MAAPDTPRTSLARTGHHAGSLCQNVKVTHIRNRRNVHVYDDNCTQRRQKIAHIFSKK